MLRHDFLSEIFSFSHANGIGLALARPLRLEAQGLSGDIDLIAEARDVARLMAWIREQQGLTVTAQYRRPDGESCFVYGLRSPGRKGTAIDFITELSCKGVPYLSTREALLRSEEKGNRRALHPVDEALVLLMTSAARHKNPLKGEYSRTMSESFLANETALTGKLVDLLGERTGMETAEALRESRFSPTDASHVLKAYLRQAFRRDGIVNVVTHRLSYYSARLFQRCLSPRHMICFYGIDGSGKTTLINTLRDDFDGMAHLVKYCHFKPLLPSQKEPDSSVVLTDPQGKPPRHAITSMAKAIYYVALHWLSRLWPWPTDVLYVYDRGIWDFYVDPKRFRYGGPTGFLRWINHLTPRAFASVFVDISPETAQKRKQEVSLEESRRQAEAYRMLASRLPNSLIVRGDLPHETMRKTVCEFILRRMAEKTS